MVAKSHNTQIELSLITCVANEGGGKNKMDIRRAVQSSLTFLKGDIVRGDVSHLPAALQKKVSDALLLR